MSTSSHIPSSRRYFQSKSIARRRDDTVFEPAIIQFKLFLDIPAVRKTLARMKIHNAFGYLAEQIDKLKPMLSVEQLMNSFRTLMDTTRSLLDTINRWAPRTLKTPVELLWAMLERVSVRANEGLEKALGPTRDYLDALSNRLRVEADGAYRARPGNNTHVLGSRESAELALITKEKPDWVDVVKKEKNKALENFSSDYMKKVGKGWPSNGASNFKTFHKLMRAVEVPPGERLYRVVEPGSKSYDNGAFWMREVELKRLTSKSEWWR